ncbi:MULTISPECIES: nitroreductase family protein [Clostridium]|uniref:Nitroreductase family protein n=1 Tax=Clostridium frigoriphilum TaxID=443253 RepID=A0ABU7USM5_9CLOT|nr:nitroreductase family protein [Clostridium sp. DSM 17811]MBU3100833.1 nitroreductase family protein [Clostridium sp. DSM 17811]
MEIEINASKCIKCGSCKNVCPENIFRQTKKDQVPQINNSSLCFACGQCISVCPQNAIKNENLNYKEENDRVNPKEPIIERDKLIEFYKNRHSIRQFTNKEISDEDMNLIIEAGSNAPSAHNQHNIKAVVTNDSKLIAELSNITSVYLKKTIKQLQHPFMLRLLKWMAPNKIKDAGKLLRSFQGIVDANEINEDRVFFNSKNLLILYGPKNVAYTELDGILALGNCMDMARGIEIGSFIPGYFIKASENNLDIYRYLEIPKDNIIVGALALGYSKNKYVRNIDRSLMKLNKVTL